jgi:hypothetical protein
MTEKGPNKVALWQLIKDLPAPKLVAVERLLAYLQHKDTTQTLQGLAGESVSYDTDFYRWTQAQAATLRDEALQWLADLDLDLDHLAEEIESLGNEQAHAVESHLIILVQHLLKCAYRPPPRRGWLRSIDNARDQIALRLRRNPHLQSELEQLLALAYPRGRRRAIRETGLPPATFPDVCQWPLARVLDEDFWPEATP